MIAAVSPEVSDDTVVIPYIPRVHFRPIHASKKRYKFVVAHRRAGKTVALANEIIKRALENPRTWPPPRYAYIGPSFAQTKDLVWGYFKHYALALPDTKVSEGDLQLTLGTGAMINLYGGAAAFERMRGLYFDGAVADEYALLNSSMFGTVVRPCLADYQGWFVASGTSNGDDHFHALKVTAEKDPDHWDIFSIPVNTTDALDPQELEEMRRQMTADEYAREMLCSFDAPMEGSYYGEVINEITMRGQITGVPYDNTVPCFTMWDLGIDDEMVVWICQIVGRELHVIDYVAATGKGLEWFAQQLQAKGYFYAVHVPPHDIKARELGTGVSRYEIMLQLFPNVTIFICPDHKVEDGIIATRSLLHRTYFDKVKTEAGVSALKNYHRGNKGKPVHNWASHPSDAFRTGAVALNHITSFLGAGGGMSNVVPFSGPIRRNLKRTRY